MNTEIFKDGVKAATKFNPIFGMATKSLDTLTAVLLENEKNRVIAGTTNGFFGARSAFGYDLSAGDYLFAQLPTDLVGCIEDGSLTMPNPRGQVLLKGQPLDANYLLVSIQPLAVEKEVEPETVVAEAPDPKSTPEVAGRI